MTSDDRPAGGVERVEKVGQYHWRRGDVEYRLTDLPSDPCHECGSEISEESYCYFRDRPDEGLDHICWDCGHEVTGFGDTDSNGEPFADGGEPADESEQPQSTITAEGDIVVKVSSDELEGKWRSDLSDDGLATFDSVSMPDDVSDGDRVYFESGGLLYAQATVREVNEQTVATSRAIRLRAAADCPVEVPERGFVRIEDGRMLPASDRNISSDTTFDVEGSR